MNLTKTKQYRILLVEDDDSHAELFTMWLRKDWDEDYSIERVSNLGSALFSISQETWDLIVLDLGLPESVGLETLRLVNERGGEGLPIVVQTTTDDVEIGKRAIEEGALDFITKDFTKNCTIGRSIRYSIERQKQRIALDQAREDLRNFAHCAAHDLKAPLATITNCIGIVKTEIEGASISPIAKEFLDCIESCAAASTHLVKDLLKFSEFGDRAVHAQPTRLEEVAHKAKEHLQTAISKAGATVEVQSLPELEVDGDLMLHVLQNLISNAIKYKSSEKPRVVLSCVEKEDHFEIWVADNGMGIAEKYHHRIFEPFKRLTSIASQESSGLGLSICKRIIEAHEGKIWVDSELGNGSVFKFRIPASQVVPRQSLSLAM